MKKFHVMNFKNYVKFFVLIFSIDFLGLMFLSNVYWLESLFLALITAIFLAFIFPGVTTKVDRLYYKFLEKVTSKNIDKNK